MLKVYPMAVSPNISPQDSDHTEYITSVHQRTSSPSLPMDTLELAPGRGVGPFRLGDSLWTVLDMLRARKTEVPKIEVSWDPDNAPKSSVTVHAGPITLLFPSSRDQRLAHILVGGLDSAALTLTYEGTVLSSSSHPLTRAGVARALGPTYAADGAARLAYPGVSFKFASASTASGGNKDAVVEVNVTPREEDELPSDALVQATLLPGTGAKLTLPMGDVEVTLNETSAQDLLLDLGPPLRKYWKEDDRMDRMWGKPNGETEKAYTPTACFWNYFQHGLDFLVVDGTVTKIIAHSNTPGTPQFQQYARCPWIVQTDNGTLDITATLTSFRTQMSSDAPPAASQDESTPTSAPTPPAAPTPEPEAPRSTGGGKKKKKGGGGGGGIGNKTLGTDTEESRPVTPNPAAAAAAADGKAADIPPDAMLLDRSVEGGLDGVLSMSRSQLVGFPGLVVEVDEATGAVVSVQVWRE